MGVYWTGVGKIRAEQRYEIARRLGIEEHMYEVERVLAGMAEGPRWALLHILAAEHLGTPADVAAAVAPLRALRRFVDWLASGDGGEE